MLGTKIQRPELSKLTEIIDKWEEPGAKEHGEKHSKEHIAVLEKPGRQCSAVLLPHLNTNEDGDHGTKAAEEPDDLGVVPGVVRTAPLQGKKKADDGGNEDGGTGNIQLSDARPDSLADGVVRVAVNLDEEEDDSHGESADRKVDVEAPAPGNMVGKGTTEKRTGD